MDKDDLKRIESYCLTETCGDPVPSFDGGSLYEKANDIRGIHGVREGR